MYLCISSKCIFVFFSPLILFLLSCRCCHKHCLCMMREKLHHFLFITKSPRRGEKRARIPYTLMHRIYFSLVEYVQAYEQAFFVDMRSERTKRERRKEIQVKIKMTQQASTSYESHFQLWDEFLGGLEWDSTTTLTVSCNLHRVHLCLLSLFFFIFFLSHSLPL